MEPRSPCMGAACFAPTWASGLLANGSRKSICSLQKRGFCETTFRAVVDVHQGKQPLQPAVTGSAFVTLGISLLRAAEADFSVICLV